MGPRRRLLWSSTSTTGPMSRVHFSVSPSRRSSVPRSPAAAPTAPPCRCCSGDHRSPPSACHSEPAPTCRGASEESQRFELKKTLRFPQGGKPRRAPRCGAGSARRYNCRGGEGLLCRLFEPLGYKVTAVRHPLDKKFAEWIATTCLLCRGYALPARLLICEGMKLGVHYLSNGRRKRLGTCRREACRTRS